MKSTYVSPVERGILTSEYKREIRSQLRHSHLESISKVKRTFTSRLTSTPGTVLQVSFFAFVLIFMTL